MTEYKSTICDHCGKELDADDESGKVSLRHNLPQKEWQFSGEYSRTSDDYQKDLCAQCLGPILEIMKREPIVMQLVPKAKEELK